MAKISLFLNDTTAYPSSPQIIFIGSHSQMVAFLNGIKDKYPQFDFNPDSCKEGQLYQTRLFAAFFDSKIIEIYSAKYISKGQFKHVVSPDADALIAACFDCFIA